MYLYYVTWKASFKLCIRIRSRSLLSNLLRVRSRAVFPREGFDNFNDFDDSVLLVAPRLLPLCDDSVAHLVPQVFSFVTLDRILLFPETINFTVLYESFLQKKYQIADI